MHVYHYAAYEVIGAEAAHVRVRHARGGARRPAARRGLRRPLQGRLAGAAALARALRPQAGRDVLLRAHGRPARRRRLDRALRGLARAARPGAPRRHRRLQRGGLRLDARAARLAAAAAARRRRRSPRSASRASRPPTRPRPRSCAQALLAGLPDDPPRRRRRRPAALAAGAAAPLPPPRGEAGLVGVLRQDRAHRARSSRSATPRRSAGSSRPGRRSRLGQSLVWPFALPRAAAPPRAGRRGLRPGDRRAGRHDRGARRGGRDAAPATRADRSRTKVKGAKAH